ncbi:MAG: methyltransferase domain-containing protein [Opitutales bacterium]|nr:methyltransferase domain-containing protein [Opitutales bacterium]
MAGSNAFDQLSERYDGWFDAHPEVYRIELEAIRDCMPPDVTNALEVGVGTGRFAGPLGIQTGVEPSDAMARIAENRGIRVYRATAETLPFDHQSFDLVLLVTTICFLDDVPAAFSEAYRVLRPGGHILIGFVDKNSRLGRRYEQKRAQSPFYKDATFFTSQEVSQLLVRAGFHSILVRQIPLPGDDDPHDLSFPSNGSFVVIRGSVQP